MSIRNAISVDVEDYFHAEALASASKRERWDTFPRRVVENTLKLYEIFDQAGVKGTFFFLGWVAERHPELVKQAVAAGHEIACHSHWHRAVFRMTPEQFREDTLCAKKTIEDIAGVQVVGYRAPSFSITKDVPWAHEILAELGFVYDSSVNPIRHGFYGNHEAPRTAHALPCGLLELPITTWSKFGQNVPAGGGAYLRVLPYPLVANGIRQMNSYSQPAMIYLHPWEIDHQQPRLDVSRMSKFRHYTNLDKMEQKFTRLLTEFPFTTIREAFLRPASAAVVGA
jgi:polysaccharide deacetylase family protein (PEP-CTERM system associated)